jgi:hypothetical protein
MGITRSILEIVTIAKERKYPRVMIIEDDIGFMPYAKDFLTKLEEVKGYILADITTFPNVEYWSVDSYRVIEMYLNGDTSKESKISRDKIMKLTRPASGWIQEDLVAV